MKADISHKASIKDFLHRNGKFFIFSLLCILVIWGYEIFTYTISIDDELHFFDTASYLATHSTRQGRWGGGFLNILLGNSCGIPVIPMIESLLCISAAFYILGRVMGSSDDELFLFYPLFIACPTWYYLFSFWMVSPNVGIDLILVSAAFLGFMQRKIWIKIVSLLMCALAVGSYEISIILLPMLCSAHVLSKVVSEDNAERQDEQSACKLREYLFLMLKMLVFMLVCVALYYGIGKVVRWICGLQLTYTSNMFSLPTSWSGVQARILTVLNLACQYYMGIWYPPEPREQGHLYLHCTLIALSLATIVICILKAKKSICLKLLAMAFLLLVMFAPFVLRFMTTIIPPRGCILVAFSLVTILFLAWRCLRNCKFLRFVFLALLVAVSIQYMFVVNRLAYASKIQSDRDCDIVKRVVERLEAEPAFFQYTRTSKVCPFIMVGAPHFGREDGNSFVMPNDTVGRSILDWQGGDPGRFSPLARVVTGRKLASPGKATVLKFSEIIDNMPIWPLPGSVVMTNGVAIAKFSDDFSLFQLNRFYKIADDRQMLFFPRMPGLSEADPSKHQAGQTNIFSFSDSCVKRVSYGEHKEGGVFVSTGGDFRFYTKEIKADAEKLYLVDVCYTVESTRAVSSRTEIFYRDSSISWNHGIGEISFMKNKLGENRFAIIMPGRLMHAGLRFDLSETAGETIRVKHINITEVDK